MMALRIVAIVMLASALAGCERAMHDMYDQRRYKPLAPSEIFADGKIARPLPQGAIPASGGSLAATSSGRLGDRQILDDPPFAYPLDEQGAPLIAQGAAVRSVALADPLPITLQRLERGRERFDVYCAPCHGAAGYGDGVIVKRGFPAPPSYHSERLRRAADSHFYAVITHGYGAMFPYADRVAAADRWAIVAYIRALQLSQHAQWASLPADIRARPELQPQAK